MRELHGWRRPVKAVLTGATVLACVAATGAASSANPSSAVRAGSETVTHICRSSTHETRALRLSRDILAALDGRSSVVAIRVEDRHLGIECYLNGGRHYDSASTVKATILAALLRMAQEQQRSLTSTEKSLAWDMITVSDNDAATTLWNEVGMVRLQHFLDLANMKETELGQDGYWGLTQITAHDELRLMRLLIRRNTVLTYASRRYELHLMANVISSQRWGVPAGAPSTEVVHVKNGWLPIPPYGYWVINSVGCFTHRGTSGHNYSIVVLTDGNPTMGYGITTIEKVAVIIHRLLNPGTTTAIQPSSPSPSWGTPDEQIPWSVIDGQ